MVNFDVNYCQFRGVYFVGLKECAQTHWQPKTK